MTLTKQILTSCSRDAVGSTCGPSLPVPSPAADLSGMAAVRLHACKTCADLCGMVFHRRGMDGIFLTAAALLVIAAPVLAVSFTGFAKQAGRHG